MADPLELAWAAGFFEGEGCVSWTQPYRSKRSPTQTRRYIRIAISQFNDPYTLNRFLHAMDGRGVIYGPSQYSTGQRWTWICNVQSDVIDIMADLDPYLSNECVKRKKFNQMIESGESREFPEYSPRTKRRKKGDNP